MNHMNWTRNQQQALNGLGIPRWSPRQAMPDRYYYRLGNTLIVGDCVLPVAMPQWLADLCWALAQRPVAVSSASQEPLLDFSDWLDKAPPADVKRQWWQRLQHG